MYEISGKLLFKGVVTPRFRAFGVSLWGCAVDLQLRDYDPSARNQG